MCIFVWCFGHNEKMGLEIKLENRAQRTFCYANIN